MKVKVDCSALSRALLLAVLGLALFAQRGMAGTSAPALRAQYRDGARVISFERTGRRAQGLEELALALDGRLFHAWVGNDVVVQVRNPRSKSKVAALLKAQGLRLLRPLSRALGLYLARSRANEDGAETAVRLAHARELAVVPDLYRARTRHALSIPPNDPRYGGQWYLAQLNIEEAWRIESGKSPVTIAIIDDGCDLSHPDLAAKFVGGIDVLDADEDPSFVPAEAGNEHGTACAGIAAAVADNSIGIAGTCPGCTLSCIRLVGGRGRLVPLSADLDAFEYAFASGAAVVSNSWGYEEAGPVSAPLQQTIARLTTAGYGGRGAVVVFAAGNENRALAGDELTALPNVLTVGAVNRFDEAAPFSNFGPSLDLCAPTGSLTTDISGADGASADDYTNLFGGTSAACPVVAGIAGLLRGAVPEASADAIREALTETARKAPYATPSAEGHDLTCGYGIVDPVAALHALRPLSARDAGVSDASLLPEERDAGDASDAALTMDAPSSEAGSERPLVPSVQDAATDGAPSADGGCALAAQRQRATWPVPLWLLALTAWARRMRYRQRRSAR